MSLFLYFSLLIVMSSLARRESRAYRIHRIGKMYYNSNNNNNKKKPNKKPTENQASKNLQPSPKKNQQQKNPQHTIIQNQANHKNILNGNFLRFAFFRMNFRFSYSKVLNCFPLIESKLSTQHIGILLVPKVVFESTVER